MMLNFVWNNTVHELNASQSYATFNLGLTETDESNLEQLKPSKSGFYDYFGHAEQIKKEEITNFLKSIAEIDLAIAAQLADLIERIVKKVLIGFGKECGWVTLRASTPNPAFDIPRYHFDGNFFPGDETQAKFLTALTGPGTLFHPLAPEGRSEFNKVFNEQCKNTQIPLVHSKMLDDRRVLAGLIAKADQEHGTKDIQMQTKEGGIFLVGNEDSAAIHSEPPINAPRLFMSIVPGNKENIDSLKKRFCPK